MKTRIHLVGGFFLGALLVAQGCAQVLGFDEEPVLDVGTGGAGGGTGGGGASGSSCTDKIRNGTETDVDCGGLTCGPCGNGKRCEVSADCQSQLCNDLCLKASCGDGVKNGDESGEDCGGSCAPCAVGLPCNKETDCQTSSCMNDVCQEATCSDMVTNGVETGVDCGGVVCPSCMNLEKCAINDDCQSSVCKDMVCQAPTCLDDVQNGNETDLNCGGTQCAVCPLGKQCLIDADCVTKHCVAGTCEMKEIGTVCAQGVECASTFCVDGVCCDNECVGECHACTAAKKGAGADGTCGLIAIDGDPDEECADEECADATTLNVNRVCDGNGACKVGLSQDCGAYVCVNGASCPTTCLLDADCQVNFYCDGANQCVAKKATGQTCGGTSECSSDFCVDGYCCESACTELCKSCGLMGFAGLCVNIPLNETDTNPVCGGTDVCNGSGLCKRGNGQACAMAADCASNNCADNVCCGTACTGTCKACNLAGSMGACTNVPQNQDDVDTCIGSIQSCDGNGFCKFENGRTCSGGGTGCLSGVCADGVCCDNACTTQCQACNVMGSLGTCSNIPAGGQDTNAMTTCMGSQACDGAGACKAANGASCMTGAQCASTFCVDGVCCSAAMCGTCQTCNKNLMLAGSCQNVDVGLQDADSCTGSMTCNGMGGCVALKPNGQTCAGNGECSSTYCFDGVCCSTSCTGECQSCNVSGSAGSCVNILDGQTDSNPVCPSTCNGSGVCRRADGQTCTAPNQCVSGVCSTTCQAPTCSDTVKNGGEGDIDCGGSCPTKCGLTKYCNTGNDCASGDCSGGVCISSTCTDGAMNGTETDIDCGGSCTTKCANGKACIGNGDCGSNNCNRGLCVNALCNNGMLDAGNGETAIDCGGNNCQICPTLIAITTQGSASPYNVQFGIFNGTSWTGGNHVIATASTTQPAVAITKTRYAIGVVRKSDNTLASMRWIGALNGWAGGLSDLPGNPKADGNPDASAFGPYVEVAFRNQGGAGKYFTARH
ncbi:MAG TPA: hypothetical protein PK156_31430, partial [Polyangium sp.]|nr:hypothetical protein [Polyangium sp.]